MTILVTGASGFIGGHLLQHLQQQGRNVLGMTRGDAAGASWRRGNLDDPGSLSLACQGVSTVIHCAGYAHAFGALQQADVDLHWRINCEGARRLVQAAGAAGVRRFVFLSSVKAMGEPEADCVSEDWQGGILTPYGQAKQAAEAAVQENAKSLGMEVVILRPAMVYGPGGKGNLERMARAISRGRFPPLPETGNHRSLVHVDDMVAAIVLAADLPQANGRTYIVAHPEAPSGGELYEAMRRALGLPPSRWHMPERWLRLAGQGGSLVEKMLRRRMPLNVEVVSRLLDSAWYSPARLQRELGWAPRVSLEEGLRRLVATM